MFEFAEGFNEFIELGMVCKRFKKIQEINVTWLNFVKYNFPELQTYMVDQNPDKSIDDISWKCVLTEGSEKVNQSITEYKFFMKTQIYFGNLGLLRSLLR